MLDSHHAISDASPWVKRFAQAIPQNGLVLDLACGSGRNAVFLAGLGRQVLAVDRDITAISSHCSPLIEAREQDLEGPQWPLSGCQFSGIVVTNYLYRPFLLELPKMLCEGGVLIYETFAQGNAQFGKPANPNFLLKTGELLSLAAQSDLKVLAYEDIYLDQPKPAMVQRMCAVKGHLEGCIPLQFNDSYC